VSAPGFVPTFVPPSGGPDVSPPTSPMSASDRLVASRALLRAALHERVVAEAVASSVDPVDADATPLERLWHRWRAWRPFGLAGVLAARTADAVVNPMVQRHPVRMTLGAALLGGLLVWSRPWQWTLGSALLAGWLPRLVTHRRAATGGDAWLPLVSAIAAALVRRRDDGTRQPTPDTPSTNPRVNSR